jgi:hypothetical protein
MECRPKSQATYRIVMVGSSLGMGLGVPEEQTFGALLPKELSRRTGNKVELYNESCTWEVPHIVDMRFNEVLVAKPDMILWVRGIYLTPPTPRCSVLGHGRGLSEDAT